MPSSDQVLELRSNTSSIWTTKNGVYGLQFIGSNGGIIFMPAAGCYIGKDIEFKGKNGCYWSSSSDMNEEDHASSLIFDNGTCDNLNAYRIIGYNIRAVTK